MMTLDFSFYIFKTDHAITIISRMKSQSQIDGLRGEKKETAALINIRSVIGQSERAAMIINP